MQFPLYTVFSYEIEKRRISFFPERALKSWKTNKELAKGRQKIALPFLGLSPKTIFLTPSLIKTLLLKQCNGCSPISVLLYYPGIAIF